MRVFIILRRIKQEGNLRLWWKGLTFPKQKIQSLKKIGVYGQSKSMLINIWKRMDEERGHEASGPGTFPSQAGKCIMLITKTTGNKPGEICADKKRQSEYRKHIHFMYN